MNWPGDVGGQGNEGVAGQVKQLVGSIGYVELAYAKQNNLTYAQMKNKAGNYISAEHRHRDERRQGDHNA